METISNISRKNNEQPNTSPVDNDTTRFNPPKNTKYMTGDQFETMNLQVDFKDKNSFESRVCRYRSIIVTLSVTLFILTIILIFLSIYLALLNNQQNTTLPNTEFFTASDTQISPWYRLPSNLKPLHYDLTMEMRLHPLFNFNGTVVLTIECLVATRYIVLNCVDLDVTSVTLTTGDQVTHILPTVVEFYLDTENELLVVDLDVILEETGVYNVTIEYSGDLGIGNEGLFLNSYKTRYTSTEYYVASQCQPTAARKILPCFDEPSYKATFLNTLIHDSDYRAISNSDIDYTIRLDNHKVSDHFIISYPMSTYLLAFHVSKMADRSITIENTQFTVWAPDDSISETDYMLSQATDVLLFYFDMFTDLDIDYTIEKTDNVVVHGMHYNAMENWGLVTYAPSYYFYQQDEVPLDTQKNIMEALAHEYAHYWTGNLVTVQWWNDLWINEGFAVYLSYRCLNSFQPQFQWESHFLLKSLNAMKFDSLSSSHPISGGAVTYTQYIPTVFSVVSYRKSFSVLRMISDFISETTFDNTLKSVLEEFVYDNIDANDLIQAWINQASLEGLGEADVLILKTMLNTWLKQIGYPVVTLIRNYSDMSQGSVTYVSQQKYQTDPQTDPNSWFTSPYGYIWSVPVRICTERSDNCDDPAVFNLNNVSATIDVGEVTTTDWVLGNAGRLGFYRVNYDDTNWGLIIDTLKSDYQDIEVVDRLGLVSDIFNLAKNGIVSVSKSLLLAEYLIDETDYYVWSVAETEILFISSMFNDDSEVSSAFCHYIRDDIIEPVYSDFYWLTNSDYNEQYREKVVVELACHFNLLNCVETSLSLYNEWMINPDWNIIDPQYRTDVYCTALRNAATEEIIFAWERIFEGAEERPELIYGLTCTNSASVQSDLITMIDSGDIDVNVDLAVLESATYRTLVGDELMWYSLSTRWDNYTEMNDSPNALAHRLTSIVDKYHTDTDLSKVVSFAESHADDFYRVERVLGSIYELISGNINTVSHYRNIIASL